MGSMGAAADDTSRSVTCAVDFLQVELNAAGVLKVDRADLATVDSAAAAASAT